MRRRRSRPLTVIGAHIVLDGALNTDEAQHYKGPGKKFAKHEAVNHGSGEYARGENHLQAYLYEFDFRYSNHAALGIDDTERTRLAIKGAEGKRLTYQDPRRSRAA